MVSKKTTSTAKADKAVETKTAKPVVEKTEVKSETNTKAKAAEKPEVKTAKTETAAAKAIETKKDSTKKLETKAAVLVDTPEVKAEEKKAPAKKTAAKKTTKTTAKKAPAKKTTTKKAELKTEMFLQFSGKEYTEKEILQKVKDVWTHDLKNKVGEMKDVKIYLKPEESAAYFVVNKNTTGKIDL